VARQRLGQHFLTDKSVIENIISHAGLDRESQIVEIGSGKGALTELLYAINPNLSLIEADQSFIPQLSVRFPLAKVYNAKAEEVSLDIIGKKLDIISNLPYYASVFIFNHLTREKQNISQMLLMFQKEVADRISAEAGVKAYGSLSLFSRYHWEIDDILTVQPESFTPPPKVVSKVLRFRPRTHPPVDGDEEKLFKLIRQSFTQKRRTLKNNLKQSYSDKVIESALQTCDMSDRTRAETISLTNFTRLLKSLDHLAGGDNE